MTDDVEVGDRLPALERTIGRPQLFRYSAITWNPHRIHYDPEHAREEGHPDVLVQQDLHGALVQGLLLDWLGDSGRLSGLSWRNIGRATAGQPLRANAEVAAVGEDSVRFEVWTETDGDRCAEGTAAVSVD